MGTGHTHFNSKDLSLDPTSNSERRLWWAIGVNMLLTAVQVLAGIASGSLSLIADALHNFSDAASLLIAMVAISIGRKPPDRFKSFGYKRAETIAALINLTTLALIGIYLSVEAFQRFYSPVPIEGWAVVIVASVALIIDIITAFITYKHSQTSLNIRAAFLHNLTDALASVGIIIAGITILIYGWIWIDAVVTLLISVYVLWQSFKEMPKVIHILMQGTPFHIKVDEVRVAMTGIEGVEGTHHLHIWHLDEQKNALEAHVVLSPKSDMEGVKKCLKNLLKDNFSIEHSTLEFETKQEENDDAKKCKSPECN